MSNAPCPHCKTSAPWNHHALFWGLVFAGFTGFLWLFGGILTPFVMGMAIAYLLNPAVSRLERAGLPRGFGALIILAGFFAALSLLILLIWPVLQRETLQLAEALPGMIEQGWNIVSPHIHALQAHIGNGDPDSLKKLLGNNIGNALKAGGGILAGIGSGGQAVAGFFGILAITPLAAFFMMKEWNRMKSWIDSLLPPASRETIAGLLREIDGKMAGFIRGQISVACALALFYSIGLMLCGLKFGFLIGLTAGGLYIIPYLGTAFGLIASFGVAFFQGITWILAAKIAGLFILGQIVETYFLTPRLVGKSVGLHPLIILFAVMAGGTLFGLTGMLLAVPVAAVIGVLAAFGIARYKKSPYYSNASEAKSAPAQESAKE